MIFCQNVAPVWRYILATNQTIWPELWPERAKLLLFLMDFLMVLGFPWRSLEGSWGSLGLAERPSAFLAVPGGPEDP